MIVVNLDNNDTEEEEDGIKPQLIDDITKFRNSLSLYPLLDTSVKL